MASLARNLFELSLFFLYFTGPVSSEAEWLARLNLMRLNDCVSRIKLFGQLGIEEELEGFEQQAEELRERLRENPFFDSLGEGRRKTLLNGHTVSFFSLREIARMVAYDDKVWGTYELLSSHTHSLPLSFYRTSEQGRVGLENEVERGYIAMTLSFCAEVLDDVVRSFQKQFAAIVDFTRSVGSE